MMFQRLATSLGEMRGWRRWGTAYVFGFIAAFGLPPFYAVPLLWLSFPVLCFMLAGAANVRMAFWTGWCFAFGYLTFGLHWIAGSLFVDIKSFWWALPLALAGLPALFAIYYGIAAVFAHWWGLSRPYGIAYFALCWFLAEMGRGHLFTGFPWGIVGYVWSGALPVLQSTAFFGIEGLTLLTLILAVLPAAYFFCKDRKMAHGAMAAGLIALTGFFVAGHARLHTGPQEIVPNVRMRLVQPKTSQAMKWLPEQRLVNFQKIMDLTFGHAGEKPITHYIWPETAIAYHLTEEEGLRARIAEALPKGSVLLTGTVRRQVKEPDEERYYNSLVAMDSSARVVAGYDKYHLVPFGEYMPLRSVVPVKLISTLGVDFTAGDSIRTIRAPGLPPFSPLICYEAIFSGDVAEREDPPSFLLNVTNDAWYDRTIGIAQHFAIVRVRAIEQGIPLVRVANNGITGVIDSYGRVTASIGADEAGYIDVDLPSSAKIHYTPFGAIGQFSWFITGIYALFLALTRIVCREDR